MTFGSQNMTSPKNNNFSEVVMYYALSIENYADIEVPETKEDLVSNINSMFELQKRQILMGYWMTGELINSFDRKYGEATIIWLAGELKRNAATLYKYCDFAEKFSIEQVKVLMEGPINISWRLVADNLSLGSKKFMELYQESTNRTEFTEKLKEFKQSRVMLQPIPDKNDAPQPIKEINENLPQDKLEQEEEGNLSRVRESEGTDTESPTIQTAPEAPDTDKSQSPLEKLETALDKLKTENAALQEGNSRLKEGFRTLQDSYSVVKNENDDLKQQISELKEQKASMAAEIERLNKELAQLSYENIDNNFTHQVDHNPGSMEIYHQ